MWPTYTCKICGYQDDTDAEFDWSCTICDGCSKKGHKAIIEYQNTNHRDWFILPMIEGKPGLYYSDSQGLAYFYACSADHAVQYACDVYDKNGDLENGKKIRKAHNDYFQSLIDVSK